MIPIRRILRKRWVLAVIFFSSLTYFAYNMSIGQREQIIKDRSLLQAREKNSYEIENVLRMLKWHSPSVPLGNSSRDEANMDEIEQCRNSQQGKDYIADELGYVCTRKEVDQDNCCIPYLSTRYQCESCNKNNCCNIYEHCVSCCMMPDKRPLLESLIRETVDSLQRIIFTSVKDQFELCLSKCRTSSLSVQHENTYRDSKKKHCFGSHVPDLELGVPETHR